MTTAMAATENNDDVATANAAPGVVEARRTTRRTTATGQTPSMSQTCGRDVIKRTVSVGSMSTSGSTKGGQWRQHGQQQR